ncbi:MAG: hypothetical protein KDD53_10670, partial [Bdellovibrionales bacterium]|nr:hypothetical protein [Bdellovibrionales bacterium]
EPLSSLPEDKPKDTTETTPGKVQPSQYIEPSWIQKFAEQITLSFSLFFLTLVLTLLLLFLGLKRVWQRRKPIKSVQTRILSATDLSTLNSAFRSVLTMILETSCENMGNEQIKSLLRRKVSSEEALFIAQTLLDEIDLYRFSPREIDPAQFNNLKEKALMLVKILR